jgi:hypothetical protein
VADLKRTDPATGLQLDKDGNICLSPVTGWVTAKLAESSILLAVKYAESEYDLASGGKQIQFALTPQQCLDLSAKLTTLAKSLMASDPSVLPS